MKFVKMFTVFVLFGLCFCDSLAISPIQYDSNRTLTCSAIEALPVDVDNAKVYSGFNFNESWISKKYFWQSNTFNFERRYKLHAERVAKSDDELIQVFILPHSHNDPGWLNTYEQYYYRQTKHILDNAVTKLTELPEMTFVWSEITYLAKWWEESSVLMKDKFKNLVDSGRLEIATGGWVVPDEAANSMYTLISELTEGQQWVKNNLNVTARYSWAIDPFGHSSTMSYLLKESGIDGMIIQRLHYAWKHYLAQYRRTEFRWRQRWDSEGHREINCHTLPYDLYSIKHACGPEPEVCLKFDFRSIQYEYGENYGRMTPITRYNVHKAALEIVEQYQKTASLTNHNVVLVPLGDDFRYDRALEWEQQYANYMQLFDYINSHQDRLHMKIQFGTLSDYFEAVAKSVTPKVSLSGDFFPYGDVYVSGEPAYWTGYYGTRPYWKRFHREVESELRSAEILFTVANRIVAERDDIVNKKVMEYKYQDLVTARRHFSLFAHHDGITGTSRVWTMDDYGDKLHSAYQKSIQIQQQSIKIIQSKVNQSSMDTPILKDFMREKFEELPAKLPVLVFRESDDYQTVIKIFNSLGWRRTELVKVLVKTTKIKVLNSGGYPVPSQVNPVFSHDEGTGRVTIVEGVYELVFPAALEALGLTMFTLEEVKADQDGVATPARVICEWCGLSNQSVFQPGQGSLDWLQNEEIGLKFQENGLLNEVVIKTENYSVPLELSFGMYKPTNAKSGAYLLKPVTSLEWKFFQTIPEAQPVRVSITGPVMSQLVAVHHDRYETIKVNTTLINNKLAPKHYPLPDGILLETYVDFSRDTSNRAEVYMRLDSALNTTGSEGNNLVMFTDQNGFTFEERQTVPAIGYEGNTYPVTTMAYIQDNLSQVRLSVAVDRTHGFNSMKNGRLETLIERKSVYDDGRGMAEGVSDSRPTLSSYRLLVEALPTGNGHKYSDSQPTLSAHQTSLKLNYPPNIFVSSEPKDYEVGDKLLDINLINEPLPEHIHLINLRTLSSPQNISSDNLNVQSFSSKETEKAGSTGLLNLQYLSDYKTDSRGKYCNITLKNNTVENSSENYFDLDEKTLEFTLFNVSNVAVTSLTGVTDQSEKTANLSSVSLAREYAITITANSSNDFSLWTISPLASFKLSF